MSSLNSHPQIHCPRLPTLFSKRNLSPIRWYKPSFLQVDNSFSPYYKYRSISWKRKLAHLFHRNKLIYDFLSEIYAEYHHTQAVGFKVNYSQIRRYPATISWIKKNNVKIIHLVRHNLLKRLVSHKAAKARNFLHSTQPVEQIKVRIDPNILKKDFRRRQNRFAKYRKFFVEILDVPFLEVSYEALVDDYNIEMQKVLKFIEIDEFVPLKSELVKVNPHSLADIIENYSEVKQTLINTEFEDFLN
jgi:hypothetical protein